MRKKYMHKRIFINAVLALFLFGCTPESNYLVYSASGCVEGEFTVNVKQANGKIYSELHESNAVVATASVGFYLNTEAHTTFSYHGLSLTFKNKIDNANADTSKRYFNMPAQGQFILTQELYCMDKKIREWKSVI